MGRLGFLFLKISQTAVLQFFIRNLRGIQMDYMLFIFFFYRGR